VKSPLSPRPVEAARAPLDAAELEAAVGFWLRLAQQRDLRAFNDRFAEAGVSQLAYSILLVLEANPGCRPAGLAAAIRVRQPNLVEPLDALVQGGLVSRAPDPRDGRAQVLALTEEGERRLDEIKAVHGGLIEGYRAALGAEDYAALVELLRRFVEAGQDAGKHRSP
jgi:DNA-binding MarR family transcriptional regulator